MNLKDFIKETIIQIAEGVHEANDHLIENKKGKVYDAQSKETRFVDFDVSVVSSEEDTNKVGGGIKVAHIFNAGGENESTVNSMNTNRIKFSVSFHYNGALKS